MSTPCPNIVFSKKELLKMYKTFIGKEFFARTKWAYIKYSNDLNKKIDYAFSLNEVYTWICEEVKNGEVPLLTVAPTKFFTDLDDNEIEKIIQSARELNQEENEESNEEEIRKLFKNHVEQGYRGDFRVDNKNSLSELQKRYEQDSDMKEFLNPFNHQPRMS